MQKAFTLIELLVVVLIIGILAAIAVPQYQKAVFKTRWKQVDILFTQYKKALSLAYLSGEANGYFNFRGEIKLPGCGDSGNCGLREFDYSPVCMPGLCRLVIIKGNKIKQFLNLTNDLVFEDRGNRGIYFSNLPDFSNEPLYKQAIIVDWILEHKIAMQTNAYNNFKKSTDKLGIALTEQDAGNVWSGCKIYSRN